MLAPPVDDFEDQHAHEHEEDEPGGLALAGSQRHQGRAGAKTGQAPAGAKGQRAQHQAKMFAKVDTDSSGSVDQTELSSMLSDIASKTGTSLGDSKELFTKMDSNSDGSLSSDELDKGMKDLMPPSSTMDFAQSRGMGGSNGDFHVRVIGAGDVD